MSWLCSLLTGLALVLALGSCTQPASAPVPVPPVAPAKQEVAKPAYKKPVRMNGRGEITSISLEQFFERKEAGMTLVFDARPSFFYRLGHIPGAISMPLKGSDADIAARESEIKAALAAGKTLIVYCTSITCPDARSLAIHFSGFGYPVSVYSGGWDGWRDAGMPLD